MGSSFAMFLGVKYNWLDSTLITMSNVNSDMAVNFWRAWWAWLICFAVTIIVSLFTERKPDAELIGLVKGLTTESMEKRAKFYKTPEFYAFLSIVVFIALNVYFW
jgi:SSS family solute:Na+ symporter